jgi:hypothetical protein
METQNLMGVTEAESKGTVPMTSAKLTQSEMRALMNTTHPAERQAIMAQIREARAKAAQAEPVLSDDELEAAGIPTARSIERIRLRQQAQDRDAANMAEQGRQRLRDAAGLGTILTDVAELAARLSALETKRR